MTAKQPKTTKSRKEMKKSKPNQLCIEGADPQTRLESLTGRRYKTDTANGLTNAIIEAVKRFGGFASRINCGADVWLRFVKDVDGKPIFTQKGNKVIDSDETIIHKTPNRGIADILAVIRGRYVAIEVKIGRDRQRPEQKEYQRAVESAGGAYVIAKDFTQFYNWLVQFSKTTAL